MRKKEINVKEAKEPEDIAALRKNLPKYLMCPYNHITTRDTGRIKKEKEHILYQCNECNYSREGTKGENFYSIERWRKVHRQDYEYKYKTVKREKKGSKLLYKTFFVLFFTTLSIICILLSYFTQVNIIFQVVLGVLFFISCFLSCYFRPRVEKYSQEDLDRKSEYSKVRDIRGRQIEMQEDNS